MVSTVTISQWRNVCGCLACVPVLIVCHVRVGVDDFKYDFRDHNKMGRRAFGPASTCQSVSVIRVYPKEPPYLCISGQVLDRVCGWRTSPLLVVPRVETIVSPIEPPPSQTNKLKYKFSVLLPLRLLFDEDPHRLLARLRAAAEAEPQRRMPALAIEVHPGHARHTGDVQNILAQRCQQNTRVSHIAHTRVKINLPMESSVMSLTSA